MGTPGLGAKRGSSGSLPTTPANFRHSPSDPTATCTGADPVENIPYGC